MHNTTLVDILSWRSLMCRFYLQNCWLFHSLKGQFNRITKSTFSHLSQVEPGCEGFGIYEPLFLDIHLCQYLNTMEVMEFWFWSTEYWKITLKKISSSVFFTKQIFQLLWIILRSKCLTGNSFCWKSFQLKKKLQWKLSKVKSEDYLDKS